MPRHDPNQILAIGIANPLQTALLPSSCRISPLRSAWARRQGVAVRVEVAESTPGLRRYTRGVTVRTPKGTAGSHSPHRCQECEPAAVTNRPARINPRPYQPSSVASRRV